MLDDAFPDPDRKGVFFAGSAIDGGQARYPAAPRITRGRSM
jgi:hypothetical protein